MIRRFRIARPIWLSFAFAALCLAPASLCAQAHEAKPDPAATALSDALSAACRLDAQAFAGFLTADNGASFRSLPAEQRDALLKRFLLLEDPGKPLLSNDSEGHIVLRCDASGVVSDVHFGATEMHDNLAFIPVQMPKAGEGAQSGRFGLVREDGRWKLLSLGLLLLDVPQLAHQWQEADLGLRESSAVESLRAIATALGDYRQAFGQLPDSLAQLGPSKGGNSPDQAGLLDADLAAGERDGYRFRYNIVPVGGQAPDSERDQLAGFQLAGTPVEYGKDGRRSFFLDATGALRGADKHGAVANSTDPRLGASSGLSSGASQP